MVIGNLRSRALNLEPECDAQEFCYEQGWTDGLPVIPPTEAKVCSFLDYIQLEPSVVVGEIPERDRNVTVEKVAINAVMAGCKPEYMPVVLAAVAAITDPRFKFNHLASLGSPWPMLIVSGPVVEQLGMNYGTYALGPGCRATATIGRALSLLVGNCCLGSTGGIQRGTYGHPGRFNSLCLAENPQDFGWVPHNVEMGYQREESVVTALSTYPCMETPTAIEMEPKSILAVVAGSIAEGEFVRGVYPVILSRPYAEVFVKAGWSKDDMREYLFEATKRSVASLKARVRWGVRISEPVPAEELSRTVRPEDSARFVYLWKSGDLDKYLFHVSATFERKNDVYFIVAGSDESDTVMWLTPYMFSSSPVTKPVRPIEGRR